MEKRAKEERAILKTILIAPILFIFLLGFLASGMSFFSKYEEFEKEKMNVEKNFFNKIKSELSEELSRTFNIIDYENSITTSRLKKDIKDKVYQGYEIIENHYLVGKKKGYSNQKILKNIKESLRFIKFNNNRGYYFVYGMKGECILLPPAAHLEGKNLWNLKDSKGVYTIQGLVKILQESQEGFYKWHWYKPNNKTEMFEKIGFGKYFEPLDIFVGTGEYIDDVREDIKKELIEKIERFKFQDERVFWIVDSNFNLVTHPNKKHMIDKSVVYEVDANGDPYIRDIVNKAIDKDLENFNSYTLLDSSGEEEEILSFARYYHAFDWIIVSQTSTRGLLSILKEKQEKLDKALEEELEIIFTIFLTLLIVSIFFSVFFNKRIKRRFLNYTSLIDGKNQELKALNESLEKKVQEEVKRNREQERLLLSQSRLAAIGETMMLISHHWRQPLNVISLVVQDLKEHKWKVENQPIIDETIDDVLEQAQYLSKTVDSFRNFYAPNSEKEFFDVDKVLETVVSLIKPYANEENIIINVSGMASTVFGYKNEFSQVLMNIVNNAKESIEKRQESNSRLVGFIEITIEDVGKRVRVVVSDNGEGIDEKIKDKIFTPYFTTKFQSKGTGLGLYMSKMVIEKSMNGTLEVENNEEGCKFIIEIERERRK